MTPTDLLKRGLRLEYLTLGWNVIGTAIVIGSAIAAGSVALAGFGINSLIEIFASVVVVWQLNGTAQHRERRALRLIGAAFCAGHLCSDSISPYRTLSNPSRDIAIRDRLAGRDVSSDAAVGERQTPNRTGLE